MPRKLGKGITYQLYTTQNYHESERVTNLSPSDLSVWPD